MQDMVKDIMTDRGTTERNDHTNRTSRSKHDHIESLSKIQVLEIENKNLKSILQKENFECATPPKLTHRRVPSYKSELIGKESGLKEMLMFREKENRELRSLMERGKAEFRELQEKCNEWEERGKQMEEEIGFVMRKNEEMEEWKERLKAEIERGKKEKMQAVAKAQRLEDKVKVLMGEIGALESELLLSKEKKESINGDCFKHKSKAKVLKQKLSENCEKLEKVNRVLATRDSEVQKQLQEIQSFKEILNKKESHVKDIESENEVLRMQLSETEEKLSSCEKDIKHLKESQFTSQTDLQQSKNELITSYEEKIYKIQQEASERAAKSAQDILAQIELIEEDHKVQLQEKSVQISELNSKIADLTKKHEELISCYKELQALYENTNNKNSELKERLYKKSEDCKQLETEYEKLTDMYTTIQEEFCKQHEEYEEIYNKEVSQHKADVFALEIELQKAHEAKTKSIKTLQKIAELYKIIKSEFIEASKKSNRAIFQEILTTKKFLKEYSQVLLNKLTLHLRSWSVQLTSQTQSKKQIQEQFFRESEDMHSVKLHLSQIEREIQIKDERISYLEASLKKSLSRSPGVDPELMQSILREVSLLEESYSSNYQEQVDLIITLKSFISKERMESFKEFQEKCTKKDFLLYQARSELMKLANV